ncbi:LamG-like jellyroll fold domain-containing protein [Christiangramia echinicola]|uniref:SprB repeat-containing protein n=1 Tax=Christiangramia echinicola TaxID=279359 RepID=A0A1H1LFB0_9FLAO|nr:LamG-like jellyroll fold domain-containing protein [Christiangramia echinicola]SDR73271.1 SprB repeat-containing protein [Christiangramia echinicola]
MYKTTFGSQIQYVLKLLLIFLALTSLKSAREYNNIDIQVTEKINPTCPGSNDGSINITVSGGTAPYSYSWSSANYSDSNNEDISGLYAGNYTINITDSSGNSGVKSIQINDPDPLTATAASSTPVSCNGGSDGSITAGTLSGGNGTYSYSIDGVNFQSSKTFSNLTATNYTVTIKDAKDCQITQSISVTEPGALTATAATSTPVSCNGGSDGSITAGTPSGGNGTYSYSIDGVNFQSSKTFSNLSAANYTITIKDAKNCQITQSISVTEPGVLNATAAASTPVSCNGGSDGSITAGTPSGGNGTYSYSIDGVNFQSSKTFSNLTATNYTVTIKDAKDCQITQSISVTEPGVLNATAATSTPVSCNGGSDGSITAGTPSGGNGTYSYSIDGVNFQSSKTFSNLSATNYTVTIKDVKDCQITQSISVTEPGALTATAATSTPVSCNGGSDGSITAGTPSGGNGTYSYSIDGVNFQSSKTFSNLSATNYTVTIKDVKDCQITQSISVTEPGALTATAATSTPVSCNGGSDGSITAGTPSGGNGTYSYSIDGVNFQSSKIFSNLSAANYTVTIKDVKDCLITQSISVAEPVALTATAVSSIPVSCNGGSDGSITAGTPSGGNGTYSYSIDGINFQSSKTFSNLTATNYTVTIKDIKDCQITQSISVAEPAILTISGTTSTSNTCYGGSDGSITAGAVAGGTSPYQYSIDNTNFFATSTFNGLSAGDYTVFVVDANGCALQDFVSVSEPNELSATLSNTNVNCFAGNDGTITFSEASGGNGTYQYSIDGTAWQTGTVFNNLIAGTYSTYIRDASHINCEILLGNIDITEPTTPLTVSVTSTRTTSFGSSTGTATANSSGGTPGYTYEWRNQGNSAVIQTTKTANNLSAGTYEVTVTDTKGCTIIQTATIIDALEASIASRSICEEVENEDAIRTSFFEVNEQTAYGGVAPYTYSWDFGTGATNPTRTGVGEHTVYYNSTGNKTIVLTVTDSTGESISLTQQNYVGNCYEPCGKSENFVFDPNNIYIGDVNGNPVNITTVNNCINTVDKYIFIEIDKSANAYNPYIELIYKVSNSINQTSNVSFASGCREGEDIDDDPNDNKENKIGEFIKLTLDPINFNCGDNLDIENFYITWTNVGHKKCGQNNNSFCYSSNEPVIVPTPLSAEATPQDVLCKENSTGTISTQVSGGYAPYSYNLTGHNNAYQNSKTFNNLAAGTYTVYVRDSRNNTTESNVVVIDEPAEFLTLTTSVSNPTCFGDKGSATVTATGGTPNSAGEPYQYLWNDASEQSTATATGLNAGNYTVTVIDASGCQEIASVVITEPAALTVPDAGVEQSLGCGNFTTNLTANTPVEGMGTWSIDTANSTAGGSITDTSDPKSEFTGPQGTYTLVWTIANPDGSCNDTDSVVINIDGTCAKLDFDGIDDHVLLNDNYGFTSGAFSIEVWVKPESVSGIQTIYSKRDKTNLSAGGYDLIINNGAPTFRWKGKNVTTSSKLTTSRWYHLAVIYSGNVAKLYVDGIEVGNNSATNPGAITAPFILGAMYDTATPDSPKNYYSGWMEELRIWNKALSLEQLRFMMNQRIEANATKAKGEVLPMDVPGSLAWSNLIGYYRLDPTDIVNGETPDISASPLNGIMFNIETDQTISAPLPYISEATGNWRERTTWDSNIGNTLEKWWDVPNGAGINGDMINWNIVEISHDIDSSSDIYLLGLLSESNELKINGSVSSETGQGLTITDYLKLDGNINLEGNSQLVQTEGSVLAETSSGYIDIDQQGTANSFNYNYWTSPVSLIDNANNSGFIIEEILKDGSNPANPQAISFNYQYHWADGNYSGNTRISKYWLYVFHGDANNYFDWQQLEDNELLNPGIGYSMKGTRGYVPVTNKQNYSFRGKPNNGDISVAVGKDQNLLTGNPYPSAIDSEQFIQDNLDSFNGSIYFWDHFGPENSHYLEEYVGGYAVYNLSGGVSSATSIDSRINANNDTSTKSPQENIFR